MKRNHEVKLLFTKEEKEKLDKKAMELGLKLSQYIRMISIKVNLETSNRK